MKTSIIRLILLATTLSMVSSLGGCATSPLPTPAPGKAALRLIVSADPKAGYRTANYHVLTYDAPTSGSGSYGYGGGGADGDNAKNAAVNFEKVDYSSLDEVVIWLEPIGAATTVPTDLPPTQVDVDPWKPADRLSAAVSVGQHVTFHHQGDRPGTVYSVSDGNNFHLGTVAPGASGEYVVQSPGLIEVVTTSLTEPIATIYAAPTPWVRMTRAGEAIDFNDLPPGRYRIVSWHPRLPGHETTVTLSANQVAQASIDVGVNGLPKVGP